jgi:hypothetical protein
VGYGGGVGEYNGFIGLTRGTSMKNWIKAILTTAALIGFVVLLFRFAIYFFAAFMGFFIFSAVYSLTDYFKRTYDEWEEGDYS